ncbi:AI-2E family transporter [uncultured Trichococcus sp.]|uniref:AI-2E family transporter n=1 Tax=uncultured Trichococcus sp. TaxID=189665 RepID=UPI0029C886A5|nr:AI-2E family transporter [uncultured Trichococcus sp.]
MQKKETKPTVPEDTRLISFLGGRTIIFILSTLILFGVLIFTMDTISFIFKPLQVIFSTIVAPVILAIVFYYIFNPMVTFLEGRRINRGMATALVFVLFILMLVYGIVLLVPILSNQLTNLVNEFPSYIEQMNVYFDRLLANSTFKDYYEQAQSWLDNTVGSIPELILEWVGNSSEKIMDIFSTISSVVVVTVTFPVILFFMLKDQEKFKPFVMKNVPPVFRDDIEKISRQMSVQVGSYVQGQLLVALSLGALLIVGYLIIGLDYAFVLALIATLTAVIPFIGATIGVIPALFVAAFTSPAMLLKMAVVWALAQFIQGNIIEPSIMGRNLKMHPLTIIIVLLIMGNLLGLIGMILGVPLFAMLKILLEHVLEKFKLRYNRYFGDVAGTFELAEADPEPINGSTPVKDFATVDLAQDVQENENDTEEL